MSYNGSGTFVINSSGQPVVTGTTISSTAFNALTADLATGLSTALTKDGQTTPTTNIPMGSNKLTGLAAGTATTDAAQVVQVQAGLLNWAAAGGTADALTATYSPVIAALVDGLLCYVRAGSSNATTAPTFSPSGLTARTITRLGGGPVVATEWSANQELQLRYNLANTRWELLNWRRIVNTDVSGLGTMSTQAASAVNITGGTLSGITSFASNNVAITGGSVTGITDIVVADGGTGAGTFTDGGVMIGNGTGALQVTTAGTSGQVLTSNGAGVDPTFQAIPASGALLYLGVQTASASASLDFTSLLSASYNNYRIDLNDIVLATTTTELTLQVSTDNGSNWKTSGYISNSSYQVSGANGYVATTSGVALVANVYTMIDAIQGTIMFSNVNSTTTKFRCYGETVWENNANALIKCGVNGHYTTTGTAITAVRLICVAGNITSGTARLYGVSKA